MTTIYGMNVKVASELELAGAAALGNLIVSTDEFDMYFYQGGYYITAPSPAAMTPEEFKQAVIETAISDEVIAGASRGNALLKFLSTKPRDDAMSYPRGRDVDDDGGILLPKAVNPHKFTENGVCAVCGQNAFQNLFNPECPLRMRKAGCDVLSDDDVQKRIEGK